MRREKEEMRRVKETNERRTTEENERRRREDDERRREMRDRRDDRREDRREERREDTRNVKIKLPKFEGSNYPLIYLDWEVQVDQVFKCHHLDEKKKVDLASLEFEGNAKRWWGQIQTDILRKRKAPIHTWIEMKKSLRKRFGPPFYTSEDYTQLERESSNKKTYHFDSSSGKDKTKKEGSSLHKPQSSKSSSGKLVLNSSIYSSTYKNSSTKCFKCLEKGHIALNCPTKVPKDLESHDVITSVVSSFCSSIPPRDSACASATQSLEKKLLREMIEKEVKEKLLREEIEKEVKETELRERKVREERERKVRVEREIQERIERENKERKASEELRARLLRIEDFLTKMIRVEEEKREKEIKEKELREKELREKEGKEKELREIEIREKELVEKQEREKYPLLDIHTNPLFDCEHFYFKGSVVVTQKEDSQVLIPNLLFELEEEIAQAPPYKNPFVLVPKEELYIKEQWLKQFEKEEVPKELNHQLEKNSLTLTTSLPCDVNFMQCHMLIPSRCVSFYTCGLPPLSEVLGSRTSQFGENVPHLTLCCKIGMHSSYVILVRDTVTFGTKNKDVHLDFCLSLCRHLSLEPCLDLLTYDIFMMIAFDNDLVVVFDPGGWFHALVNNKSLNFPKFSSLIRIRTLLIMVGLLFSFMLVFDLGGFVLGLILMNFLCLVRSWIVGTSNYIWALVIEILDFNLREIALKKEGMLQANFQGIMKETWVKTFSCEGESKPCNFLIFGPLEDCGPGRHILAQAPTFEKRQKVYGAQAATFWPRRQRFKKGRKFTAPRPPHFGPGANL